REWLYDPVMCKYLRPSTLFGTNFESYLNQKMVYKSLQEEDFDLNE
ncbi:conserved phage C-terminal domain-containing protein, partial [Neobacillus sp.]